MSNLEIREEFRREDITDSQIELTDAMRARCSEMLYFIEETLSNSRYASICKTKLEEFCMFANKGICEQSKPRKL